MMKFATITTGVSALLLASLAFPSPAGALKVAYVEMQRALRQTNDGKSAFKKLKRVYKKYQKQIRKKEKALKKLQKKLKKQALVLTQKARAAKARGLQRKFLEFQAFYMDKQKKLQKRESKLMAPIIKCLMRHVQDMGSSGDYTMIFDRADSRLVYAQPSLNLTNELIRRYNSKGCK